MTCGCGETFLVNVSGTQSRKSTECPKCHLTIWLVEPLGNVVGMAILGRSETKLRTGMDPTIVLGAMAVECELVYLFMRWNRIDVMLVRDPNDADDDGWEEQWRDDVRTVAARLDKVVACSPDNPSIDFCPRTARSCKPCMRGIQLPRALLHRRTSSSKSCFTSGTGSFTSERPTFSSPTRKCASPWLQRSPRFWQRWTSSVGVL